MDFRLSGDLSGDSLTNDSRKTHYQGKNYAAIYCTLTRKSSKDWSFKLEFHVRKVCINMCDISMMAHTVNSNQNYSESELFILNVVFVLLNML